MSERPLRRQIGLGRFMPSDTAFEILIREHAAMLTAYIRAIVDDPDTVEEIFQQATITAWQRLDSFDETRPFAPWLRGIARNHMLMHFRTKGRYRRRLEGLFAERLEAQFVGVDEQLGDTYAERLSALRDCMTRLPHDNRDAVELVYLRGLERAPAADQIGVKVDTFRKRLDRGLDLLVGCMQRKEIFSGDRDEQD